VKAIEGLWKPPEPRLKLLDCFLKARSQAVRRWEMRQSPRTGLGAALPLARAAKPFFLRLGGDEDAGQSRRVAAGLEAQLSRRKAGRGASPARAAFSASASARHLSASPRLWREARR
jgi:hypothetical protein